MTEAEEIEAAQRRVETLERIARMRETLRKAVWRTCPKCQKSHSFRVEMRDDFYECGTCGLSSRFRETVYVSEILDAPTETQNEPMEWEVEV